MNFYLTKLQYWLLHIVVVCCYGSDIICPKALIRSDQIEKYSFHLQFYSSLGSMIKLLFNERQLAWPLWLTIDITHTILINYIYLESCQHIQLQFTNNGTNLLFWKKTHIIFCLFKKTLWFFKWIRLNSNQGNQSFLWFRIFQILLAQISIVRK